MEIKIGDLALLTFIDDFSENNQLKAILSIDSGESPINKRCAIRHRK